jgi:hypothetical protein
MKLPLYLAALAAATLFVSSAQAASDVTVSQITQTLQSKGAAATISEYFGCSKGAGYPFVSGGNPHAVAIASKILSSADQCVTAKLQSSLRLALIYNPIAVLPLVDSAAGLSAADICTPSGLPKDAPISNIATTAEEMKTSLSVVHGNKLAAQKQACLSAIGGA